MGKRIDDTTCHCLKMRRSAWNVVSFYDRMLKPAGITVGQYSLLNGIEEHDGCNISELGMWTELDRSTLVRSLKPLFKAGLSCDRKEAGMRDRYLSLTDKGRQVCSLAKKLWKQAQKRFEDILGKERVTQLEDTLQILVRL